MAKVIQNKELKQRKQNLKYLRVLIDQYVKERKKESIIKIKNEQ